MKKELLSLLQFILIAGITSFANFWRIVFQAPDGVSVEVFTEYKLILINWTLMFVILGSIRYSLIYLISYYHRTKDSSEINKTFLFRDNMVGTIHYLVLAIVSILTPMWIVEFRPEDDLALLRINIFDLWWSYRQDVFTWISVFFILSVLRLGIIYIKEKLHIRHIE